MAAVAVSGASEQSAPRTRDSALWRWLPVAAWMALIFALSAQSRVPQLDQPLLDVLVKKGWHFTEYAILATLLWRALAWRARAWMRAWPIAALYAMTDEFHQRFVSGRHSMFTDVLIDSAGAATALLVIWLIRRRRYGA